MKRSIKLLFFIVVLFSFVQCGTGLDDVLGLFGGSSDKEEELAGADSTIPSDTPVAEESESDSTEDEEEAASTQNTNTEESATTATTTTASSTTAVDPDTDGDGILNEVDNCPNVVNQDQSDSDKDGIGNLCDACIADAKNDEDKDGICGSADNCPSYANKEQVDGDKDGLGDSCDACPNDNKNDEDKDNVCGNLDNCPTIANATQADTYGSNTAGDACEVLGAPVITDVNYNTSTYKITITGSNLSDVNGVTLKEGSSTLATLTIESKSATSVIAYVTSALTLVGGTLYDLVVTNATAATSVSISLLPADGSVTTAKIADSAVSTAKIADNAVTGAKILDGEIASAEIASNAITTAKLSDSSVTGAKIVDSSITSAKLADDAVTTLKILDAAVTSAKIDTNAITSAKIASGAITTAKLASSAVTAAVIASGVITDDHISSSANIAVSKLEDGTNGQVLTMVSSAPTWSSARSVIRTAVADQNYTATSSDYVIAYTSLTATRTVSLPAAATAGAGAMYVIKDESGGAAINNITIDPNGSETIDGQSTKAITINYNALTIYTDGNNWHTLSSYSPTPVIGARVYNSANIAIANDNWSVYLTFDTETFDTDSIHSTVANTDRLTANTAGYYYIFGHVHWDSNATGSRYVSIYHYGAGTEIRGDARSGPAFGTTSSVGTVYYMAVGDYVRLRCYQDSGAERTALTSGIISPLFSMILLK